MSRSMSGTSVRMSTRPAASGSLRRIPAWRAMRRRTDEPGRQRPRDRGSIASTCGQRTAISSVTPAHPRERQVFIVVAEVRLRIDLGSVQHPPWHRGKSSHASASTLSSSQSTSSRSPTRCTIAGQHRRLVRAQAHAPRRRGTARPRRTTDRDRRPAAAPARPPWPGAATTCPAPSRSPARLRPPVRAAPA